MKRQTLISILAVTAFCGPAFAQQPPAPPAPPAPAARGPELAIALEAAQAAVAACAANGYKVAASVLDSGSALRVLIAADGAVKRAIDTSTTKANATVAFKVPTSDLQERVKTDQALAAKISADPSLFARAGAVPLMVGTEMIGAIGVGGAPGGEKDEACAIAAVEKVKARLK